MYSFEAQTDGAKNHPSWKNRERRRQPGNVRRAVAPFLPNGTLLRVASSLHRPPRRRGGRVWGRPALTSPHLDGGGGGRGSAAARISSLHPFATEAARGGAVARRTSAHRVHARDISNQAGGGGGSELSTTLGRVTCGSSSAELGCHSHGPRAASTCHRISPTTRVRGGFPRTN